MSFRLSFHQMPPGLTGAHWDEDRYDIVGLANFTKALPHNRLGEVDPGAYRALLGALWSGRSEDFRRIPLGGRVKLANPRAHSPSSCRA
jgi:hypothetical protein